MVEFILTGPKNPPARFFLLREGKICGNPEDFAQNLHTTSGARSTYPVGVEGPKHRY